MTGAAHCKIWVPIAGDLWLGFGHHLHQGEIFAVLLAKTQPELRRDAISSDAVWKWLGIQTIQDEKLGKAEKWM